MRTEQVQVGAPDAVSITIPAKAEYVTIARLTVAAVAARQGFTYDEIEDLKIAVSEACAAAIVPNSRRGRALAPLKVRFVPENGGLAVWLESDRAADVASARADENDVSDDPARLGAFLMQCLVDEVRRVEDPQGVVSLKLLKRRQEGTESTAASSNY